MMVKEIILTGEIGLDHKLCGEIGIFFRNHVEEIIKGILFT